MQLDFTHYYRFGIHKRPIIQAMLTCDVQEFPVLLLVDTGADLTLIPTDIGLELGIRFADLTQKSMRGVGGRTEYWEGPPIRIQLLGSIDLGPCPVGFSEQLNGMTYGILVRRGVPEMIRVAITERRDSIVYMALEEDPASS